MPLHVTVTVPVPRRVLEPIVHDQDTSPFASAWRGTKPRAVLTVPAGVTYEMAHCAFGAVLTVTDASPPGGAPLTVTKTTVIDGAGVLVGRIGVAVGGRGVAVGGMEVLVGTDVFVGALVLVGSAVGVGAMVVGVVPGVGVVTTVVSGVAWLPAPNPAPAVGAALGELGSIGEQAKAMRHKKKLTPTSMTLPRMSAKHHAPIEPRIVPSLNNFTASNVRVQPRPLAGIGCNPQEGAAILQSKKNREAVP